MAYSIEANLQRLPFSAADETTDIVFVVEEKRIHFAKTILSMCSPVFRAMFAAKFLEKDAKEIPLPMKKYADIVELFKHLHPAYGPMTQVSDKTLLILLQLADEYQINSVKEKCQQFIGIQANMYTLTDNRNVPIDILNRNLLYLSLCDRFQLHTHRERLVEFAARREVGILAKCPLYRELETNTVIHVLYKRCQLLEVALAKSRPYSITGTNL